MAFVTEYAAQEDIEKYHLKELVEKYMNNFRYDWTHNESKDVFMMLAGSGREEESQLKLFYIFRKGETHRYAIWQFFDRENKALVWEMQRYGEPNYASDAERLLWEAVHKDLKEALTSYGLAGSFYPDNGGFIQNRFTNF